MALDSLSNTGTLDSKTELHPPGQPRLRALRGLGKKLLDTVLPRHLDELGLPPQRVDGVMPFARHGVLPELERVGARELVRRLRDFGGFGSRREDRRGRIPGEEALQLRGQPLG